jgi:hypothetical protein
MVWSGVARRTPTFTHLQHGPYLSSPSVWLTVSVEHTTTNILHDKAGINDWRKELLVMFLASLYTLSGSPADLYARR